MGRSSFLPVSSSHQAGCGCGAALHTKKAVKAAQIGVNGEWADAEVGGDFFVCLAGDKA